MTQDELLTWLEANGHPGPRQYTRGTGPETIVWAVVVAGDISPEHGLWIVRPLWEVRWYNATTGGFLGSFWHGKNGNWPPLWDTLPDRYPGRP